MENMSLIEEIEQFIQKTKDGRELKRALAVKMKLPGKSYQEIKELIKVSHRLISQKLAVFRIDQCHLLWGDICSYVWGKTDIRI